MEFFRGNDLTNPNLYKKVTKLFEKIKIKIFLIVVHISVASFTKI